MVSYLRFLMNSKKYMYRQIILFQRIYYLSISLTGLPCHREPSIVLMSLISHTYYLADMKNAKDFSILELETLIESCICYQRKVL